MHESRGWPESYGFQIYGDGPAYVVQVNRGSVANNAGLNPGDMLLEVDGHNVTDMSADAITTLARHSRSIPPTLGVVTRLKTVELLANKRWGYGFRVGGGDPIVVSSVDPPAPAYQAGIRPGDIILKVNGVDVNNDAMVTHVLQARVGRLTLGLIPVEDSSIILGMGNWQHHLHNYSLGKAGSARRANELCKRLDDVLGHSYDKKMAAIGLLKHYAEDRDIDGLVNSLHGLLRTDRERSLVPILRSLVPGQHKSSFDGLLVTPVSDSENYQMSVSKNSTSTATSRGSNIRANYSTESRFVRVRRGKGSFGFILRGHSPVTVESTMPAGPSDQAGIVPGDAIVGLNGMDVRAFSHAKLVDLLRGSGTSPTLEILRMEKEGSTSQLNSDSLLYSSDSDSLSKQSDSLNTDNSGMDLKGGDNLSDYVHLLLTEREALRVVKALQEYKRNGRIGDLMSTMKRVLNTGPKRTLWHNILPRLPHHHQLQVLKMASTLHLDPQDIQKHLKDRSSLDTGTEDSQDTDGSVGSFRKQLDYLLTTPERSELKTALEEYIQTKDVHLLVDRLKQLLDTPSKRTLFFYIIPLLNPKHQTVCQRLLGLPKHYTARERREHQHRKRDNDNWRMQSKKKNHSHTVLSDDSEHELSTSSDDHDDSFSQRETLPLRNARSPGFLLGPQNLSMERNGISRNNITEPEPITNQLDGVKPKNHVRMVRESAAQTTPLNTPTHRPYTNYKTVIQVLETPSWVPTTTAQPYRDGMPMSRHGRYHGADYSRPYPGQEYQHSPQVSPNQGSRTQFRWNPAHSSPIPQSSRSMKPAYTTGINHIMVPPRPHNTSNHNNIPLQSIRETNSPHGDNNHNHNGNPPGHEPKSRTIPWPPKRTNPNGVSSAESGKSKTSDDLSMDSFQQKALHAIQALDDVVDNEQSLPTSHIDTLLEQFEGAAAAAAAEAEGPTLIHSKLIPAAPPLPPSLSTNSGTGSTKMHVKRINWEKLDQVTEDSIWAKLNTGEEELKEIIAHLQLERQFTTKRSKIAESFNERKAEVGILSPKKAYNISILLGHMKTPVDDIKDALLSVDDNLLTSDLLKQLLTFAPDDKEMEQYNTYTGSVDDLNKPDQFMYKITRVPNFQGRLKAMLFKANFHERVDEIRKRMNDLQRASKELVSSKSLAKLLELILAMGNQMNKGDSRVGGAAGFRISYLAQLDMMKTSTGKGTFLHVLADVIQTRFPSVVHVARELPTLPVATRDAEVNPVEEMSEVKRMLQSIKDSLGNELLNIEDENDRLPVVMNTFLNESSNELDRLTRQEREMTDDIQNMIKYFGEESDSTDVIDIFTAFTDFIHKLEKAHQENVLSKRT